MIIDSPIISGSSAASGSLNQFGNVAITGSLTVTGAIIGAVTGSVDSASYAANATSASYATNASAANTAVSSSYPLAVTGNIVYTPLGGTNPSTFATGGSQNTIILGYQAGLNTTGSSNEGEGSMYVGAYAGKDSYNNYSTIFIGEGAGERSTFNAFSTTIGAYAGYLSTASYESVVVGYNAGFRNENSYFTTIVGEDAGYRIKASHGATILGNGAGSTILSSSYSTIVGYSAGPYMENSKGGIFIGPWSGEYSMSGSYSIVIGNSSGRLRNFSGNRTLGTNNIIIGTNIALTPGTNNGINIGGLIFGSGSAYQSMKSDGSGYDGSASSFSGSANGRIGINQPNPQYSFDVSGSGNFTNGLTVTGSIVGALTGTASYASNANLLDGLDSTQFTLTSSFSAYTASLNNFSASILSYTSSTNLRINALDQYTASLNTRSASFACIDSTNNFACAQYFSNASNAVSFTSTGSLYSDGGVRITKDMYVSGTAFFNNVTVFGTQSVNYITSSQLNISSNIISVNTATPTVRFGGLAVYDSGSLGTGLTGSLLWDSEDNQWIYSNPSGSAYDSALFLVGPRNSGALGGEAGITCNFLSKGNGMHHMTSSGIFENGTTTCFYGNASITSAGAACFANQICAQGATFTTTGNTSVTIAAGATGLSRLVFQGPVANSRGFIDYDNSTCGFIVRANESTALTISNVGAAVFSNALQIAGQQAAANYGGTGLNFDFTSGNVGRIASVKTTSGGSSLEVHTYNTSGADVTALTINSNGITCFACQVCAPTFVGTTFNTSNGSLSNNAFWGTLITAGSGTSYDFGLVASDTNVIAAVPKNTKNFYIANCVGIGAVSPATNLHICNSTNTGLRIQAAGSNGSSELDLLSHGTQNAFIDFGPNQLRFRSTNCDMTVINDSNVLVLNNNGCVGVNTTSPRSVLHVQQASNDGVPAVGCARDGLIISSNNGNYGLNIGIDPTGPAWMQSMRFDDGATAYNLLLQPAGGCSVLIGTGTALSGCRQQLIIGGNSYGSTIAMGNNGNANKFVIESDSSENVLINNKSNTPMIFYTNNSRRMDITGDGYVGIGCTSPGAQLVVYGACNGDTTLHVQNGSVSGKISFSNNTANAIYGGGWWGYMGYSSATYHYFAQCIVAPRLEILRSSANNGLFVYSNSGATPIGCTMVQINGLTNDSTGNILTLGSLNDGIRMVVRNDGNVGIGNNSPAYKLDVVGNSRVCGSLLVSSTTDGYTNGRLHVSRYGNSSGGSILMGLENDSTGKWSYLVSTQYNSSTYPQGFSVIGGYTDSTANKVVIGGSIYEANPATEIQFWTHTSVSHNLGGSQRMNIASTGVASFACYICTPSIYLTCTVDAKICAGAGIGLNIDGASLYLNRYSNSSIVAGGSIVPLCNGTQDLGSANCRWCTVYTSDLSLNNGIGNYTIVEGKNDLFLYNNNSCKVFKFLLQEVCPEIAPAKRSI